MIRVLRFKCGHREWTDVPPSLAKIARCSRCSGRTYVEPSIKTKADADDYYAARDHDRTRRG